MKTEWDYTALANAYFERPDYAPEALDAIFKIAQLQENSKVCDIGAGVAHLTIPMLQRGYFVDAVEPNDAMRANGQKRTQNMPNVVWSEGTGEHTGKNSANYDFVSFGSSFNVCNRELALQETYRLLKSHKYFTCMWNHRQLNDPVQSKIEEIIYNFIPDYNYGARREDQQEIIVKSNLFIDIQEITGSIIHVQPKEKVLEAWRSHATLHRQAKELFPKIIQEINSYLQSLAQPTIQVPYTTRAWIAKKKD